MDSTSASQVHALLSGRRRGRARPAAGVIAAACADSPDVASQGDAGVRVAATKGAPCDCPVGGLVKFKVGHRKGLVCSQCSCTRSPGCRMWKCACRRVFCLDCKQRGGRVRVEPPKPAASQATWSLPVDLGCAAVGDLTSLLEMLQQVPVAIDMPFFGTSRAD